MNNTHIHPDLVLEAIVSKGHRSQKINSLRQLHLICTKYHESQKTQLRDFSLPSIGRICEEQGLFKARVLYNKQSADYVDLISAWAAYSGPGSVKVPKESKPLETDEYLMRIDDPAIRRIVQAKFAELKKLKAQLNLLKSTTKFIINQQPPGVGVASGITSELFNTSVLVMNASLTESERKALEKAVSRKFLQEQGWEEGSHGQIKQGTRIVFDVGFAVAIRKVLSS